VQLVIQKLYLASKLSEELHASLPRHWQPGGSNLEN